MNATECACTEEYGPCESHGTVLAQRIGSASRSADELCVVYLQDARDLDPSCLEPYGMDVLARASSALDAAGPFSSWIDDAELADELRDVVSQVESYLDGWTMWDDGYTIVRPSEDCPLLDN